MRLLKNKDTSPPDNFRYVDPDTGWLNRQVDYYTWIRRQIEHRKANGLTIPDDLEAKMQDQLCNTIPPEWCEYEKDGTFVNTRFTLADVITATRALLDSITGNYVSQEEANRRAKICSSCYLNTQISGCGACLGLSKLIAPDRKTPYDDNLKSCAVCKCYNRPQVHMELTTLSSHATSERQSQYPNFCWQKQNGFNYQP